MTFKTKDTAQNQQEILQEDLQLPKKKKFSTWIWVIPAILLALAITSGVILYFASNEEEPVSIDQLTIVIDPGHGSDQSPGAVYEGVFERDVNWQISIKVKEKLENLGIKVYLTRGNDNIMVIPEERAEYANTIGADIFVSIHQNAVDGIEEANGIETWYSPTNHKNSEKLAKAVQQALIGKTNANDRGIKEDTGLVVTNQTNMPSCLIETGFLTNTQERQKLTEDSYQEQLAQGIVEGIMEYLGL